MLFLFNCLPSVLWLFSVNILSGILAQMLPPIECPQFFKYVYERDRYYGLVTLPNRIIGVTKLEVELFQHTKVAPGNFGKIHVNQAKFRLGKQTYRIEFPLPNEIPMLKRITINDNDICIIKDYEYSEDFNAGQLLYLQNNITYFPPGYVAQSTVSPDTSSSFFNQQQVNSPTAAPITFRPNDQQNYNELDQYRNINNQRLLNTKIESSQLAPNQPNIITNEQRGFQNNEVSPLKNVRTPMQPQIQVPSIPLTPLPTTQTKVTPTRTNIAQLQPESLQSCGRQQIIFEPFVFGGRNLRRGEFPWVVPIYHHNLSTFHFQCGGSIISTRTIITAAHCVRNFNNLTAADYVVFVGRFNLQKFGEDQVQLRDIESIIVNPEFNQNKFSDADMALLIMQEPISYNEFTQPVCLWSESDNIDMIVNESGSIAGWGADENNNLITSIPKLTTTKIISPNECRRERAYDSVISPRTICAAQENQSGPCMGDSGGGLVLSRNGRWTLRGILSGGATFAKKCDINLYTIFCDVAKHIDWIRNSMLP